MNNILIGLLVIGAFIIFKFGIQPLMNAGEPIEPDENYKTLGEQIEEATTPSTDL